MSSKAFKYELGEDFALKMDADDPLAVFKNRFYHIPNSIYMDGNSLGLMSRDAEETLSRVANEWKNLGIAGWGKGKIPWIDYGETLGDMEAPLVGAGSGEVVVTNSTTVNLHNLVATFYKPKGRRRKILADELNFPSDLYALYADIALMGGDPEKDLLLVKMRNGLIDEDDVVEQMTGEVALALLPSVYYKSGQLTDMKRLTKSAHRKKIVIGFDCSHSVGVLPHHLDEWDVDFAFWCNYKYMNAGPGGTASLYVNRRLFGVRPGLAGWWGNNRSTMFNMETRYDPAKNAAAWQIGTINMFSAAPLEGSLQLMKEAGIERIREKSLKITGYLMYLIDEMLGKPPYNYSTATPRESERRGGHVGIAHKEGWRINQALITRGVIPDFRPPNIIRLAPIPLNISYYDVWKVAQQLKAVIDNKEYQKLKDERSTVT
ncbi:MAG: kynureninase [Candidatus Bathyarchaeota archaeon]|nr:kynureninase [Candidatus Bathyarchaeota archaeon]